MPQNFDDGYYREFAQAYVRGSLPADTLEGAGDLIALGRAQGLKVHRFKRTIELPRVRAVIGALQGVQPENLLDIGSGRGVFLWPVLDAFRDLHVTAIDLLDHRVETLEAVRRGGVERLTVHKMSALDLEFADDAFDVATALEVLEHMETPQTAVWELMRVARRFIVASVPSKEDDNPEHVQLFDKESFAALFTAAGARSASVSYVRGHMICFATL